MTYRNRAIILNERDLITAEIKFISRYFKLKFFPDDRRDQASNCSLLAISKVFMHDTPSMVGGLTVNDPIEAWFVRFGVKR